MSAGTTKLRIALGALLLALGLPSIATAGDEGCVGCHSDDSMDERVRRPALLFPTDVHAKAGIGCTGCHGGENSDDVMVAHSRKRGFRGRLKRTDQPEVCGSCHDDPEKMKALGAGELPTGQAGRFRSSIHGEIPAVEGFEGPVCSSCHSTHGMKSPRDEESAVHPRNVPKTCARCHADLAYMRAFTSARVRVDQLIEYRTSVHGQRLEQGDTKVATCSSCHADHLILPASDTRSSIHPKNVAATCGRCHSDPERMAGYRIEGPGGVELPLPTDQQSLYEQSVHHEAMAERGDLSAPTCNDCHGNHGATPPEVRTVATVCSQCHSRPAELFGPTELRQTLDAAGYPECATCHGHHRVVRPSDELLERIAAGKTPSGWVPDEAHRSIAAGFLEGIRGLEAGIHKAEETVAEAENYGLDLTRARLELTHAKDHLVRARVTVHSFEPARMVAEVQGTAEEPGGLVYVDRAEALTEEAFDEREFRRHGLVAALLIIAGLMVALFLKIRHMER